jgi:hypothetical protein
MLITVLGGSVVLAGWLGVEKRRAGAKATMAKTDSAEAMAAQDWLSRN